MSVSILNKIRDRYYLHRHVFPFVRRNQKRVISRENTICLFCHPRGGSTWLAEILLQIPGSCLIDEPLQKGKIKTEGILKEQNQPYRHILDPADKLFFEELYISPDAEWKEAEFLFSDILGGRMDSLSLYDEAGPQRLKNAHTYIVKFNYGHLVMQWLINKFPVTPVILTRHPCAVVASQMKMKMPEIQNFGKIITSNDFERRGIVKKYVDVFSNITRVEEYLAFWWSVKVKETLYALLPQMKYLIIAYESLLTNFEDEIKRLFEWTGKDIPQNLGALRFRPSASTHASSIDRIHNKKQLMAWKSELSDDQIKKIFNIVEKFEIDIYGSDPEPDYKKLYK